MLTEKDFLDMKFPKLITDYVRLECEKACTISVVLDVGEWLVFPLLDLTELSYKVFDNKEVARHYVGIQLCNFLQNHTTIDQVVSDYWMNQYLDRDVILKSIGTVTVNAVESGRFVMESMFS